MKINWENEDTILNITVKAVDLRKLYFILSAHCCDLEVNKAHYDNFIKPVDSIMDEIDKYLMITDNDSKQLLQRKVNK